MWVGLSKAKGSVGDPLSLQTNRDNVLLRVPRDSHGTGDHLSAQQKREPQAPHSLPKYDHYLEEPDIHMQVNPKSESAPIVENSQIRSQPDALSSQDIGYHQLVAEKKGTGPTSVAYVHDLAGDRLPHFSRTKEIDPSTNSDVVNAKIQEKVMPCRQLESLDGRQHFTTNARCLEPGAPQIVYNSADFPRIWCDQEIQPGAAMVMKERCNDPVVRLFGAEPASASGKGMPPMILLKSASSKSVFDSALLQTVECDIPCKEEPSADVSERLALMSFANEAWTVRQTMGEPSVFSHAHVERIDYRRGIYYSTTSFKSDVPLTFFDPQRFSLRNRPAVSYEESLPKGVYLVDNYCLGVSSRRNKYFSALGAKGFLVDSMGQCDHNADVPAGMTIGTSEGRVEVMKKYRFVLAFDRTNDKDFISTMVWEALISGAIPLVVGAENIRFHLPKNSYIDAGSYGTTGWDDVADAVKTINDSKEKWESYHEWRTDEAELAKFESLYEFSKTQATCRLCRWGYAKKYGLGWDHNKQRVKQTRLPRNLCTTDTNGLASQPFQEQWLSRNEEDEIAVLSERGTEKCSTTAVSTIDNKSTYKIERTLVEHDGVVDLIVNQIQRESMMQALVLRLNFVGLQNSDGASFGNSHTTVKDLIHGATASSISIQDDFSKVTILADWVTSIHSPGEGVVEIVILEQNENEERPQNPLWPNIPRRVRVIVEDMDVVNDKMTEYFPSPFAKRMIKDFVDPLEIYYADT